MVGPATRPAARAPGRVAPAWLCLCALLGGCADLPPAPTPSTPPPSFLPREERRPRPAIGVLIAGWHSGLVVPAGELGPLRPLRTDPRANYLSIGWGNRRFYRAAHPGSGDALAALFPSASALFLQQWSAPLDVAEPAARIHWLCADREALWRVDRYIERSLSRPGGPVELGAGPLPGSAFYAARGHYSLLHTCNTWTVAALQFAGLRVRSGGVILASQVRRRIAALRVCPVP
jgi:Protein of unknown function (DUF2459)